MILQLPLAAARLCVECDLLTNAPDCPNCGRESTHPVSAWLRPMNAGRPDGNGSGRDRRPAQGRRHNGSGPSPDGRRWLIVIQRERRYVFNLLRRWLRADAPVDLIYERRVGERRRGSEPPRADRRRGDRRRRQPSAWIYDGVPLHAEAAAVEPPTDATARPADAGSGRSGAPTAQRASRGRAAPAPARPR